MAVFLISRMVLGVLDQLQDLLTVGRAFNRSEATRAVALNISKVFDRVWHAGLLHKNIQLMLEFLKAPFLSYTFPTIH